MKQQMIALMKFIESRNTHGRKTVLTKLEELGLAKSVFYKKVEKSTTNIGRNQLKFLLLDSFIEKLK